MNKVSLVGRVTRDLELKRFTDGQRVYTYFTIAVNDYAGKEKGTVSNFINVVAFDKKAEILCKYITKGRELAVTGKLENGGYIDKDGIKRYNMKVILEDFNFVGTKKAVGDTNEYSLSLNNDDVPF